MQYLPSPAIGGFPWGSCSGVAEKYFKIINQAISFVSSDIISNISSSVFTSLSMPSYMSYARASAKKYKTKNGQDVVNDIAAELLSAGHSGCWWHGNWYGHRYAWLEYYEHGIGYVAYTVQRISISIYIVLT